MKAILTGASSGIGLALAGELSRRGYELALLARRGGRLEELAAGLPARAMAIPCDVTDAAAVRAAVASAETQLGGAFDLAIANAGISIPGHATRFNVADAEQIFRVNVLGMMYLFDAVIPGMLARGSGRFAGIASIAGLRGLPSHASYSSSKAAMQAFLEASRIELAPHGVGVTIVNPGFVATQMTEKNSFRMPFLMQADEAARVIANGIEKGKRVIEFPKAMSVVGRIVRWLPDAVYERVTGPYQKRRIDASKVKR